MARAGAAAGASRQPSAQTPASPSAPLRQASPQEIPQTSITRLYIDAELQSLLRLAPVVDAIELGELLLADITVSEDAMRELAVRRGVAVKDYLASRELAPARPFLGATKTLPPDPQWTPRAELNLAMP